ncbi:DNRLRE domain-containing protein [Pleionea sp. CnH1-48]|uniref:DNRLRE domain-containing protein n=1 Tax=Pleionea sp. CnH1-48 TaxID=2954494 RepID=UPI0020977127|nr:DNRLRE domain-containing protein [Pleionea sp. CnH1-48]MCO7223576.1 DNRLRE domain-containing protein [Pleionea sp. CnH1-48]
MKLIKKNKIGLAVLAVISGLASANEFSVVALPDTQKYSEKYPDIYKAQTQWVADNHSLYNILFVTHLGDIVEEAATISQWENANRAMTVLDDANVPYGVVGGNHDFLYPGDYYDPDGTNYLRYFSPSRYEDKPWFGGSSPSGLSSYQIIESNGQQYLFIHILMETPSEELAWAQGVLNQHKELPTWVSTHRYLFDWSILGAGRYTDFNYTFEPLYRHDGMKSNDFFNNFVAANRQIYLVHCGHNHSEYRQTSKNQFGATVHEVLADYQSGPNGGDGWLRLYTFQPDHDRIQGETYSPTRKEWDTDSDSRFTLNVDFDTYRGTPSEHFITLQEGLNGYSGTRDTWINNAEKNTSYGNRGELVVDDDTRNSWWKDYPGQTLLQFTDMVQGAYREGDPAPTRIPSNAVIVNAELSVNLKDDQDSGNTTYRVYPMTRSWNEDATWNSMGDGIQVGSETGGQIGSFKGDNNPNNNAIRTMNITSTVQGWLSGSNNYGVAILRDNTTGNDDGIELYSSDSGESVLRPKLSVQVTYQALNVAPTVVQKLEASSLVVNEGEEVNLSIAAQDPNQRDPLVFMLEGQSIGFATGSGAVEHHMLMEDEGVYRFSSQVKDDEALVDSGDVEITVRNLPPVIIKMTEDKVVSRGELFSFNVTAADPGALDVISYAWDLDDDGQFDDVLQAQGKTRFNLPGKYPVRVKVSDDDGGFVIKSFTVVVR